MTAPVLSTDHLEFRSIGLGQVAISPQGAHDGA